MRDSGLDSVDTGIKLELRYLPNAISIVRMLMAPILVWLAKIGSQQEFAYILLAAGVSDILDGWIARRFGWTSALGALLDSAADVLIIAVIVFGIWELQRFVLIDNWLAFLAVSAIWFIVHCAALVRYRRLASFHTRLTQVGLILFGLCVLVLFLVGFPPWFFYTAAFICFLGGVESLIMIFLIREWSPDLRGGLLEVLRRRNSGAA